MELTAIIILSFLLFLFLFYHYITNNILTKRIISLEDSKNDWYNISVNQLFEINKLKNQVEERSNQLNYSYNRIVELRLELKKLKTGKTRKTKINNRRVTQ